MKRLAASFVIACRDNGLSGSTARDSVMTCVRTYREAMAEFSQMNTLELWYYKLDIDELVAAIKGPAIRRRGIKRLQKERGRSIAEDIFPKLAERQDKAIATFATAYADQNESDHDALERAVRKGKVEACLSSPRECFSSGPFATKHHESRCRAADPLPC